ncbi:hypothetical protein BC939DRAFT_479002 [Gamsiella multidivaricata]|uniref:uncharacterized protein n=1 Tax=Gamsiella multidivaricata TaxID=101098 RepID=UPI00221E563D|nr:uncharacterized protein BC939DRAFT_479002 [Gamsiella multidivaricata]KAI7820267.1 hypothetical protein BC939DRAFT_479002 [Gamsiella multidivaricata]
MAHNNTDRSLKDLSSPNYNNPMWSRRTSSTFSSRVRIDPGAGSVNLSSVRLGRGQAPEIDQRPLSSMEFRSDRRDTRMMRSTTVMTIHSDSEPEYEVASPMAFPVERRESRLVRNATVMTIHSGSEPEYEVASPMTFPTGQRGGRMMRNTTVMTMHSDSDPEYESSHDSPTQQDQASLDGMTIIFDNGLSSIPSEDSGRNRTNIRNRHGATNIKPGSTKRSRFYRFGGPESEISDDDQATSSDDRSVDPSETFIQANDIDSEDDEDCEGRACHSGIDDDDDDDDEGDDDESELEDEPSRRKNFLGSYLLAPMGFDDDEVEGNAHAFEGFYEAAERFQVFAGVNEFDGKNVSSEL